MDSSKSSSDQAPPVNPKTDSFALRALTLFVYYPIFPYLYVCHLISHYLGRYYDGITIVIGFSIEVVALVLDYYIHVVKRDYYKQPERVYFYVTATISIFATTIGVILQTKECGKLVFGYRDDYLLPWWFEVENDNKPFGSVVLVGSVLGAFLQFVVIILKAVLGFESWIPTLILSVSSTAVVFELIQFLIFKIHKTSGNMTQTTPKEQDQEAMSDHICITVEPEHQQCETALNQEGPNRSLVGAKWIFSVFGSVDAPGC